MEFFPAEHKCFLFLPEEKDKSHIVTSDLNSIRTHFHGYKLNFMVLVADICCFWKCELLKIVKIRLVYDLLAGRSSHVYWERQCRY